MMGHLKLSEDMIETLIAKKSYEQVIKKRLLKTAPTNKKKSESQIWIEQIVHSSKQHQLNFVSKQPHKKQNKYLHN